MRKQRDAKNRKSSMGGLIAVAVIFLLNIAGTDFGSMAIAILIVCGAIFGIVFAIIFVAKKASNKSQNPQPGSGFGKAQVYLSGNKARIPVSKPVAHPSVNTVSYDEYSQEKNFIRDRERRLSQLEGLRKNGIIDKEEYNILKAK